VIGPFLVAAAAAAAAPPVRLRPPAAGGAEIRRRARDILSRPEFQAKPKSLYQRVLDFVADRTGRVLELLLGGGRSSAVGWIIVVAVLVAVGFLVVRLVRNRMAAGPSSRPDDPVVTEPRRPAADWRAAALAHEQRGEWRLALRCRYRALIADLAGRGVVEEIPGRTAGEYRDEVRLSSPEAAEPFGTATRLFERAWYGNVPTDSDQAGELRHLADAILERAR
jgi:hypothetical protein